jgi:hypothetical protein
VRPNDSATMNNVLETVLGKSSVSNLLTKESLQH